MSVPKRDAVPRFVARPRDERSPHARAMAACALLSALTALSARLDRHAANPAPLVLTGGPDVCLAPRGAVLVAGACGETSDPYWFAPPELRLAVGAPVCWWSAGATELATLRGVGDVLAERVAEYRDAGGSLARVDDIRGVGPSLAHKIRAGATERCAMPLARVPRAQPAPPKR